MNNVEEGVIMYDSDEAATYRTDIKGWVSANGWYCGDGERGERGARYEGATHTKCKECDAVIPNKSYTTCQSCRDKKAWEIYQKLPYREYDGSPVFLEGADEYFFSEDDILSYIENLEDQEEEIPNELHLLFCDEIPYRTIDNDYWLDSAPEDWDGELPNEMQEALNNLNRIIEKQGPFSYFPGKVRTTYLIKD